MIQVEVEKNLICMEDLATGTGTVQQSRGGTTLTLTKVSAEVFPYSDTQTVAQKINDLDAKYDYVIANTSTSFSISTLIRKSGDDLIDVNGDVFTPQVVASASSDEASYPAKLWVKIISSTEHHLKRGADLLAKFNPVTHAQILDLDYGTIVTNVLAALGLGTAAYVDTGTTANQVVKLDGSAKLPAVDGSQLTNLPNPVPIGMPQMWLTDTAPTGYLLLDGSTISRTTYAALFAVIGTIGGAGDGSTTFTLPDFRGVFTRGNDNGRGLDPGRVLGSYQADELASHTHTYIGHTTADADSPGTGPKADNQTTRTTNATGGAETRPKNTSVNYIVRYQ